MDKKNIAEKYYNLLLLFSDFIEHGFKKKHKNIDFSNFNIPDKILISSKDDVKVNEAKKEKNPDKADDGETQIKLIELNHNITQCTKCNLHNDSKKVTGIGKAGSNILVLSVPPSAEEEKIESPLSLEALAFFKKWLESINLKLTDVFITNVLKCAPKKNIVKMENIEACRNLFEKQLEVLKPVLIISLGQLSLSTCKKRYVDLNRSHGEMFNYGSVPVIPTFHPAEVLANSALKKAVWDDLKKIKNFLAGKGF